MVLVISQDTFDAVVKENIEELGMELEEAVKDAREQFTAQGVNLSNLVMPVTSGGAEVEHLVVKALKSLNDLKASSPLDEAEIVRQCGIVADECAKGIPERVLATNSDGYDTVLRCLQLESSSGNSVKVAAMTAMANMLEGNPDPLEEQGFKELLLCLNSPEPALVQAALECCLNCCVRHEQNRQNLVSNGLLHHLERLFDGRAVEVPRLWQALVQDDDVRVPFGNAHENARQIVEEHGALSKLSKAIKEIQLSQKEQALLLSCLSSLSVRNEYCQSVSDELGLSTLFDLLVDPDLSRDVVRESLKLIKTLAGNDKVKKDVQTSGGISVIVNSMTRNLASKAVCSAACDAVAALALRSPDNAKQLVEAGGAQLLAQIMQTHMDSAAIMTSCCNAIRNIVSRSRELAAEFVALDVEALLHEIRETHPMSQDAVKAALRDLGLKVQLKELWTGNPAAAAAARGEVASNDEGNDVMGNE